MNKIYVLTVDFSYISAITLDATSVEKRTMYFETLEEASLFYKERVDRCAYGLIRYYSNWKLTCFEKVSELNLEQFD